MREKDIFTILLSHRPELIHFYAKSRIPLIFSGHAHGGQFRIIGKNGLLAPHQGGFSEIYCWSNKNREHSDDCQSRIR